MSCSISSSNRPEMWLSALSVQLLCHRHYLTDLPWCHPISLPPRRLSSLSLDLTVSSFSLLYLAPSLISPLLLLPPSCSLSLSSFFVGLSPSVVAVQQQKQHTHIVRYVLASLYTVYSYECTVCAHGDSHWNAQTHTHVHMENMHTHSQDVS